MQIERIVAGVFESNTYLVYSKKTNRAILIDPGAESRRLWHILEERDLTLTALIATHGHLDHVGALADLRELSGAPVIVPQMDGDILNHLPESCRMFGLPEDEIPVVDHWITPEMTSLTTEQLGPETPVSKIGVHHTPGHTPGGVSLQIGDALFSGDTLFYDSVGRVDLPGGDGPTLMKSLLYLMSLDGNLLVYPGHGPATTIAREKGANPFIKRMDGGGVF